jgi:exopolyphosphatase/guanosine-5'-triphosphate,3'-diphosphate pyrophosphatase
MLSSAIDMAFRLGRDPSLPPALLDWTAPLFRGESQVAARLREAVCWLSDIGSREHPEFRSELAFLRVFRQQGIGLDHRARAFLALAIASRYKSDGEMPFVQPARQLLDNETAHRAEVLGLALRLGYMLSAGTRALLSGSGLRVQGNKLVLRLQPDSGLFAGESVVRRLETLAAAMRLDCAVEEDLADAAE